MSVFYFSVFGPRFCANKIMSYHEQKAYHGDNFYPNEALFSDPLYIQVVYVNKKKIIVFSKTN